MSDRGHNRLHGFTLIEILIVLVILGIVMSFAVLAVGDFGQSRRVRAAAEELDLLIGLAQEQAVLEPAVLGINIQRKGYTFFEYALNQKELIGQWQSLEQDQVLHYHAFPKKMAVILKAFDADSPLAAPIDSQQPQIIISPNGNITPFIIDIGKPNNAPSYRLIGQYNGELNLTELR